MTGDNDLVLDDGRVVKRHGGPPPPEPTVPGQGTQIGPGFGVEDLPPARNFGRPTLAPPPAWSDQLPEVRDLGEDGEWYVMYGHIDLQVARCAFIVHEARIAGVTHVVDMLEDFGADAYDVQAIGHRWAVEQTDQSTFQAAIWWKTDADGEITETTPGAFPITICDTGA